MFHQEDYGYYRISIDPSGISRDVRNTPVSGITIEWNPTADVLHPISGPDSYCDLSLRIAYNYLLAEVNLDPSYTHDYVRIRLLRMGDLGYDITTLNMRLGQASESWITRLTDMATSANDRLTPEHFQNTIVVFKFIFVLRPLRRNALTAVGSGTLIFPPDENPQTLIDNYNIQRQIIARFHEQEEPGGVQNRRLLNMRNLRRVQNITPVDFRVNRQVRQQNANTGRVLRGGRNVRLEPQLPPLFHKHSIHERFLTTKCMRATPSGEEGLCLPMAFMRAELRIYTLPVEAAHERIAFEEYKAKEAGEYLIPSTNLRRAPEAAVDFELTSPEGERFWNLFDNHRTYLLSEGKKEYEYYPIQEQIDTWKHAAKDLHFYVELAMGRALDVHDSDTLQYYANCFEVYIVLYCGALRGNRLVVFKPVSATSKNVYENTRQWRVVSLFMQDEHLYGITHLRSFFQGGSTLGNRTCVHNYCVFCEKTWTSNNQTLKKAVAHMKTCAASSNFQIDCQRFSMTEEIDTKVTRHRPPLGLKAKKELKYAPCMCCSICGAQMPNVNPQHQLLHRCYIDTQSVELKKRDFSCVTYAYDFECSQTWDEINKVYIHKVNCAVVINIDNHEEIYVFQYIEDFMEFVLLTLETKTSIFIAHNGGHYDVQFVLRYLESHSIAHTSVPTPNSMHNFLSVTVLGKTKARIATFIDFRNFVPGSLKGIAQSFRLNIEKGDFPHHFNNGLHDNYIGSLPEFYHQDDYWCLKTKKEEKEYNEIRDWHIAQSLLYCTCGYNITCTCSKKKWNFQEEIVKYCKQDVLVLAEAAFLYRANAESFGDGGKLWGWTPKALDPFHYLTIPQIGINLLLAGFSEGQQISISHIHQRENRVLAMIPYLEKISKEQKLAVYHAGNSLREVYDLETGIFFDGVDIHGSIYLCLHCEHFACPQCFMEEQEHSHDHPSLRSTTYSEVYARTEKMVRILTAKYKIAAFMWQCHLERDFPECTSAESIITSSLIEDRDMFYGGRTEVFSPYVNMMYDEDHELKYADVCSLYPTVCAQKELPVGTPQHLLGIENINQNNFDSENENPYWGVARVQISSPLDEVSKAPLDIIGLLPVRDKETGRLTFPVLHSEIGTWGTEELQLAVEQGYKIEHIFEVYHWPSSERSNTYLRGYIAFFLRMKLEATGWKKLGASCDTPSLEEQEEVNERVYQECGQIVRIRNEKVFTAPVAYKLAKNYLNSLWGKFCQKPQQEGTCIVRGAHEFYNVFNNSEYKVEDFLFRHLEEDVWSVKFTYKNAYTPYNMRYNIFLASKVTEHARCILHRKMIEVGKKNVLYCDTDSLMFRKRKDAHVHFGNGLGQWVDEYPDARICKLFALAPKFYKLLFFSEETLLKSKGIMMTISNAEKFHVNNLNRQLVDLYVRRPGAYNAEEVLYVDNMIIGINTVKRNLPYGVMMTRNTDPKKVRVVILKRDIISGLPEEETEDNAKRMREFILQTQERVNLYMDNLQRIYTIPLDLKNPKTKEYIAVLRRQLEESA